MLVWFSKMGIKRTLVSFQSLWWEETVELKKK